MSQSAESAGLSTIERLAQRMNQNSGQVLPQDSTTGTEPQAQPLVEIFTLQQTVPSAEEQIEHARTEIARVSKLIVQMFESKSLSSREFGADSVGMANFLKALVFLDEGQVANAVAGNKLAYANEYLELVDAYRRAHSTLVGNNLKEEADLALNILRDRCEEAIKERRVSPEVKRLVTVKRGGPRRKRLLTWRRAFFVTISFLVLVVIGMGVYPFVQERRQESNNKPYDQNTVNNMVDGLLKYKPTPPASNPWLP